MSSPAITATGLTKRYGDLTAVDALHLEVPQGQVMAFLGSNGAGKSTTIEMILGLVRPDSGSVGVLGATPAQAVRRGSVGAMLQNGALLGDTNVRGLLRTLQASMPEVVGLAGDCGEAVRVVAENLRRALEAGAVGSWSRTPPPRPSSRVSGVLPGG